MSDECKLKIADKFGELDAKSLDALEEEIARLESAYGKDTKAINAEMKTVLENFVANEKYTSARIISDKIKTERLKSTVIVEGDFKATAKNILNLYEGNNSVETTYRTYAHKYTNQLRSALTEANLEKEFYSGEFDELIFEEAFRQANGLPSIDNKIAKQLYGITKKLNNQTYNDMLASGLNVKYRKDFLISRNYDSQKMLNAGQKQWVDDMLENFIDIEKTFSESVLKTEGSPRKILESIYDDIVEAQSVYKIDDLVGKSNAMNKLKGRKFEFRDGKAEHAFNQAYGSGKKLGESMEYQIDRNAKTVANVSVLGTDAEITHNKMLEAIEKSFRDTTDGTDIHAALNKANKAYREVVAPPHQPTTAVHKSINMVRGLQAFTKLGSSIFAAMWDINSTALQYASKTSGNQFEGYAKAFISSLGVISKSKRKELGRLFNVNTYFNDAAVVLGGHKGDYDTGFDKVNRFFSSAQKFTGVPWQTEISRVTNGDLMTSAFNQMMDNVDNLNEFQKIAMKEYGISADDLKFIKKHAKKNEIVDLVTPFDILDIDSKLFGDSPLKAIRDQNKLYTKMSNYIDDAVNKGTPTPTAKVKRHLLKDRSRDETTRAFASLIMQFKETAWKIALANKEALDIHYQAKGISGAALGTFQYMTLGMISYMGIETTKAMLFGYKTPLEKLNSGDDKEMQALLIDFINKSSVAPVITDGLSQGASPHFGNNFASYAAGPTLGGTVPDAFNIAKSSNKERAARRFIKRNALPSNWVPIKAAQRSLFEYDFTLGEKIRK